MDGPPSVQNPQSLNLSPGNEGSRYIIRRSYVNPIKNPFVVFLFYFYYFFLFFFCKPNCNHSVFFYFRTHRSPPLRILLTVAVLVGLKSHGRHRSAELSRSSLDSTPLSHSGSLLGTPPMPLGRDGFREPGTGATGKGAKMGQPAKWGPTAFLPSDKARRARRSPLTSTPPKSK